jgi:hypothetical protein
MISWLSGLAPIHDNLLQGAVRGRMNEFKASQEGFAKTWPAVIGFFSSLLLAGILGGLTAWGEFNRLVSAVDSFHAEVRAGIDDLHARDRAMEGTLAVIAKQSAENTIHYQEHLSAAGHHIRDIEANKVHIIDLKKDVAVLQKEDPRPDPFTGTEGKDLSRRIDRLENRVFDQR